LGLLHKRGGKNRREEENIKGKGMVKVKVKEGHTPKRSVGGVLISLS